jgi:cell division septation protein DedD
MSKTDGEYELVLGNRQLLSAFFIVVILFGVFFTMGYVVGRNSAPASAASLPPATVAGNQRPEAASPAAPLPQQSTVPPPPQEETKERAPVETRPVTAAEKPQKPQKKEATRERAARPTPPPAKKAEAPAHSGIVAVNPGPGNMYLQVAAVAQPQAGVVVDTLKQKGFPVMLSPGPNATLFRVMVGPFPDAAALGKAKADLESAGFHPLVRK